MSPVASELVRKIPVYSRLSEPDLQALVRDARTKLYIRGQCIFREGDDADAFVTIVRGRVKVFRAMGDGKELIVAILGAGNPVGVVAVLRSIQYPATAMALEDTVCLQVPRDKLDQLLENPSFVRGLLAGMASRMMELTNRLATLSGPRVDARLSRLFLKLASETGQRTEEGVWIPVRLSRQELADLTGTTVETCIRIMSRWEKEGTVHTRSGGFLVPAGSDLHAAGEPES